MPRTPPSSVGFYQHKAKAPKTLADWIEDLVQNYKLIKGDHIEATNKVAILTAYQAVINDGLAPLQALAPADSAEGIPLLPMGFNDKLETLFKTLIDELKSTPGNPSFARVAAGEYCQPFLDQYSALKQGTPKWTAFISGEKTPEPPQPSCAIM